MAIRLKQIPIIPKNNQNGNQMQMLGDCSVLIIIMVFIFQGNT